MNEPKSNLSNVNTLVTETEIKRAESNLAELENLRKTITDYTEQTLRDVNSQPLIVTVESKPISPVKEETKTTVTTETDETVERNSLITEFYEKFSAGQIFQTLEELRRTAFEYGRKHNVALTTSKSDKTKIYLICKHGGHYRKNVNKKKVDTKLIKTRNRKSQKSGCCCLIYARCGKGSYWTIRKSIGEHNHVISEDPRTYAMYRSLEADQLSFVHKLLKENIGISNIVKSLTANGINNIVAKDIENIQQDLKRKEAAAKLKQEILPSE